MSQPGVMSYGSGLARNSIVQVAPPRDNLGSSGNYAATVRLNETSTSLSGPVVVVNTSGTSEQPRSAASATPATGQPSGLTVQAPAISSSAATPGVRSASAGAGTANTPKIESANLALVPPRTTWETPASATPTRGFEALN